MTARIHRVQTDLMARLGTGPGARSGAGPLTHGRRTVELRVAASVTHLGVVARLFSPVLAAAVDGDVVDLDRAWWQDTLGGPFPLSVPVADPRRPEPSRTERIAGLRVDTLGVITRVTDAVRAVTPVSPQVLWGNVASAVHTAATLLATARPADRDRIDALTAGLLAAPPLAGSGTGHGATFRRRSCCLIYRLAPRGAAPLCGDCVLAGGKL